MSPCTLLPVVSLYTQWVSDWSTILIFQHIHFHGWYFCVPVYMRHVYMQFSISSAPLDQRRKHMTLAAGMNGGHVCFPLVSCRHHQLSRSWSRSRSRSQSDYLNASHTKAQPFPLRVRTTQCSRALTTCSEKLSPSSLRWSRAESQIWIPYNCACIFLSNIVN